MKPRHSLRAFMEQHVNLNPSRVERAREGFETLSTFLEHADATRGIFVNTSTQGSLRQGTIIKPRPDKIDFDVDLLLELAPQNSWSASDYLAVVKDAFATSDRYKALVDTRGKNRCITIDYAADDFHIDVVPSIDYNGQCYIANRATDEFELTDGDGYAAWFASRNAVTGDALVHVVRLAKFLRDQHEWEVKSILLTTLLGLSVRNTDTAADFPDLVSSLVLLTSRVRYFLDAQGSLPVIFNPALPQETFTRHWDQPAFEQFRDEFGTIVDLIEAAAEEPNDEASIEKWRQVFGDKFDLLDEDLPGGSSLAAPIPALGSTSHVQPVEAIPVTDVQLTHKVQVTAAVYNLPGTKCFRGISSGGKVPSDRALKFKATTNVTEPYAMKWQVVNTGPHAESDKVLRGGFQEGRMLNNSLAPKNVNWEKTRYTGRHWVECFVIKNNTCVARSGPFYVNVKNPAY